ncbi:PepSY domain-containing protein [Ottowia sp.]|uniref:PepSY domain-containing protein n=1 Tax=Ottowia sp. TaxID=1898956 RepID=UPI003A84E93B
MTSARTALTTTAAALMLALAPAAWALNAQQAVETIQGQSYAAPYSLEKQYGYWTAKATSADGQRAHVLVGDADGSFTAIRKADLGTALPGATQVAERLRGLGYAVINDLDFDDGFWEAEVRQNRNSEKVEVVLHPVNLSVLSQTGQAGSEQALPASEIVRLLQVAGYTRIHDVEFDDGRWEAEATNPAGQRVDLYINATTGAVEREKLDD